jgi:ribonuclease G
VRTNAAEQNEEALINEINYLTSLHQNVVEKAKYARPPVLLYQENHLLNDLLSEDMQAVYVSGDELYAEVKGSIEFSAPRLADKVIKYDEQDMFSRFGITRQIDQALQTRAQLPCGGYITIEQTEACVIIDVNTGQFAGKKNLRETVLQTNLEAAECIAWQMALRNLSGMIIIDFIDMIYQVDKDELIHAFTLAIKKDRITTEIIGMTELGLVQLTRRKTRESLNRLLENPCPHCGGKGRVPC